MSDQILIVGAGIGGLTAAAVLLQRGYRVRVFEQAPTLGEIGAGIQISANASRVLHDLGLDRPLAAVAVTPVAFQYRLYNTGDVLHEIPLGTTHARNYGATYYHLHRADLHSILAARVRELDPDAVVLDATADDFTETENSVTVRFKDGTRATGDVLIGADGIKSAIRAQIIGPSSAEFTGYVSWRAVVPSSRLPADFMPRICTNWVGPNAHVIVYYLRRGELVNFVGLVEDASWRDESWTVKSSWDILKADFAPWHGDVQRLIDAMDRDQCYRWAMYNRPPVTGWSTRRATLLGDAAHPTLPFMAQGAAMAIEDGVILARALETAGSVPAALDLYARSRYERTARIQTGSNELGKLYHLRTEAELRAGFASRDIAKERGQWVFSYDPFTAPLADAKPAKAGAR
jgi:2-polyprenyl-6-methoxyphenol hydroxylase-like FAD-dependent oxidoreductase